MDRFERVSFAMGVWPTPDHKLRSKLDIEGLEVPKTSD